MWAGTIDPRLTRRITIHMLRPRGACQSHELDRQRQLGSTADTLHCAPWAAGVKECDVRLSPAAWHGDRKESRQHGFSGICTGISSRVSLAGGITASLEITGVAPSPGAKR
jgi:hypothetical protein